MNSELSFSRHHWKRKHELSTSIFWDTYESSSGHSNQNLHLTRTVEPGRISDGTAMSSVGFLLSWTKDLLPSTSASSSIWPNGIIFHQPKFSWNKGLLSRNLSYLFGGNRSWMSPSESASEPAWNMVPRLKWQSHQRCSPMGHSGVMIRQLQSFHARGRSIWKKQLVGNMWRYSSLEI